VTLETDHAGHTTRQPAKLQVGGLNKVEQIVCYIAQSYVEPITVTDIGKAVGMHPNSAMRLFKKVFGTTLVDHLTHHRIFHAKRLLATTDQKIVDVAYSSGFSSISRFNEAFRRASGCTPRAYRLQYAGTE
jgi:AraC-like DNA-binding protein